MSAYITSNSAGFCSFEQGSEGEFQTAKGQQNSHNKQYYAAGHAQMQASLKQKANSDLKIQQRDGVAKNPALLGDLNGLNRRDQRSSEHEVFQQNPRANSHSISASDNHLTDDAYSYKQQDIWIERTDIKIAKQQNKIQPHCQVNNSNNHRKPPALGIKPWVSKPAVLSPKPFVPPKPRRYSEGNNKEDNTRPPVIKRVTAPLLKSPKPIVVSHDRQINPSVAARDVTGTNYATRSSTLPRKLKSSQTNNNHSQAEGNYSYPARTNSLKRSKDLQKVIQPMMTSQEFKQPSYKSDLRKIPPKIATKPKSRNPNATTTNNISQETPSVPHPSEIRNKFEGMKMKFKKPVEDVVYKPQQPNYNNSNGPISQTASELFKDILEMQDLDGFIDKLDIQPGDNFTQQSPMDEQKFGDDRDSNSSEPTGNGNYEYINDTWSLDFEKPREKVEPSQNLKDLKTKFESEFESKVINSLISPTEKKKFFKQTLPPRPQRSSSLDENRKKSTPISSQTIEAMQSKLQNQFPPPPNPIKYEQTVDNDDFPAPPILPSPPEPPLHSNASNHKSGPRQSQLRSDAQSGMARNETCDNNLSADKPYTHEESCNKSKVPNQGFPTIDFGSKNRNFEEEILYYDNMDIMEKVRQKEQEEKQKQDEKKLQSISKQQVIENSENLNKNKEKPRQEQIQQQLVIDNQNSDASKSISTEFKSAMGNLEYEYLKLKANLDHQTISAQSGPPKLPPKQKKLKREADTKSEDPPKQDNSVQTPKPTQHLSLGLKLNIPSHQPTTSNHVLTPMPSETNSESVFKPTSNNQPPMPVIPVVTPEEMRARTLVDEPLAPIMEEDSQYGDSSSCASSIVGDAIIVDDQSSIKSLQSKGRSDSPNESLLSSLNSSRNKLGVDDSETDLLDGETTETDTPEVFLSSSTTVDSGSDAASLKWNTNPIQNQPKTTQPQVKSPYTERSISKDSSASKEGVYEFLSDEDTASNRSYNSRHSFKREVSHDSRSSVASFKSSKEGSRSQESVHQEEVAQQHEQQKQRQQQHLQQQQLLQQQQQQLQQQQKQRQQQYEQQHQLQQNQQHYQQNQQQQNQHHQQNQQQQQLQQQQKQRQQQYEQQQKQQQQQTQQQHQQQEEEIIHDVEPYGMVDLTNLDHKFEDTLRYESCDDPDDLTPSGIMTQVNEFNTLPKQPKPVAKVTALDENLPNFPMNVDVNRPHAKPRSSGFDQTGLNQFEEVGYDNLENYGGAARKAANEAKELKAKYAQSAKKKHERSRSFDNKQKHHEYKSRGGLSPNQSALKNKQSDNDSLSSTPGLTQQSPGSRASFPLPVSATHLSRHSSAVSALDRHSGNLKRSKTDLRPQSKVKSPSERRIEKLEKDQQSSTLPRTHAEKESGYSQKATQQKQQTTPLRSKSQDGIARQNSTHSLESNRRPSLETQQSTESFQPFPVGKSDYDESLDDGVVNPYEEVPFLIDAPLTQLRPDTEEQKEAKHRVREILENIKPPESLYKPKPPLPRYPVEYDNFYLGDSKSRASSGIGSDEANRSKVGSGTTSSTSTPPSPTTEERTKTSGYSDSAPVESQTNTSSTKSDVIITTTDTPTATPVAKRRTQQETKPRRKSRDETGDSSDAASNPRSLGSQLRSLLGGSPESKYISPSLRRKRSLLKRSKSPGGSSRRARSPARSKEEEKREKTTESTPTKNIEEKKRDPKEDRQSLKSEIISQEIEEEPRKFKERSASQRIVDRRGRAPRSSRKSKGSEPEDESTDHTLERKSKSRMWRRSKSTDRESPTRSKSKERKLGSFSRRSKSTERPKPQALENKGEIDIGERGRSTRSSFFRRSRSSSRKRERGRSSERNKEEGGRNPVNFFKKLLRNKKEEEEEIVHVPLGKGVDLSDSSEALSTILAYKGDEVTEPGRWTPPRPHPPQQQTPTSTLKKGKSSNKSNTKSKTKSSKTNKPMRSPPSHRAKKILSTRAPVDRSTGSSSEGNVKAFDAYGNMGSNRAFLNPQKPSRKSSFSNSVPSSDSDSRSISRSKENILLLTGAKNRLLQQQEQKKSPGLRRNLLANRDYDSDTTSVLPSDPESSNGVQSDVDVSSLPRSAMKQPGARNNGQFKGSMAPRRPVRLVSKSDPSLFVEEKGEDPHDPKNTYYNINDDGTPKQAQLSPPATQEKKRGNKVPPNRRRSQKQNRRQTAPVDMAYATHQRQKYRTLVSLNAQTLRKVTERWLSEWRNQLPVGGFLITSWSDVALSSHRPLCMIGNSVVYGAIPTGNNKFNLACQLYDQRDVDDRMLRKLEDCASLPAHPNTCGVCSHFPCRVPRSLLDPSSRGGAADAVCVVLSSRPYQSLQEHLDEIVLKEDPTEYHRQLLISVLQLLQGIKHLTSSGFELLTISSEHLVITENKGFLQILPHLQWTSGKNRRDNDVMDSSDSDSASIRTTKPQQISRLVKRLLHNGTLQTLAGGLGGPGDRSSAASSVSRVVVPGTKYSPAIKQVIRHLESPQVTIQESTELVQCALWGPEDIDDVGVDDVTPYAALELWVEMEQAKLVNSLAVLMPEDRLSPVSFLKHQYFATVGPEVLFKALKTLQRI